LLDFTKRSEYNIVYLLDEVVFMQFEDKIKEKDLLNNFSDIQKLIKEWEKKYPLPDDLPFVEPEDQKPFITQPFYTCQIHAVS